MDTSLISAGFGIGIGWFFNEASQWLRVRYADQKTRKKVLFCLLDIRHVLTKYDGEDFMQSFINKFLDKIPKTEHSPELISLMKQAVLETFQKSTKRIAKEKLASIETNYLQAISDLSSIDPLNAYYLSDKAKIIDGFDHLKIYYEDAKMMLGDTNSVDDYLRKSGLSLERPIIRDAIQEINKDIALVADSLGLFTKNKVKKLLRKPISEPIDIDKILEEMGFNQLNPVFARS